MSHPPHQQPPVPGPDPYAQPYQAPYQGPPNHQGQQPYAQPYPAPQHHQGPPPGYYPPPGTQPYPPGHVPAQPYAPGASQPYPTNLACRLCGNGPAIKATFLSVVGAVLMHTISTAAGPFCRDCGLHVFRKQTTKTLAGGWCSIGALLLSPFFLLVNAIGRGKLAKLPAPLRYPANAPAPMDPGPSLFQRPAAYVFPALLVGFLTLILISSLSR